MDKFTENLTEGVRRFAMAGVGAIALTIDKSKEIIEQLAERGETAAADSEFQKKMTEQLNAFTQKLKADYENASFEQLVAKCRRLTPEQKAELTERMYAEPEAEESVSEETENESSCECSEEESGAESACECCAENEDVRPEDVPAACEEQDETAPSEETDGEA